MVIVSITACAILAFLSSFILPGTLAIFSFGPPFIFQTTNQPPTTNNTVGSFTSNISFDAITNVSNVVVAVSQQMGRSLDGDGVDLGSGFGGDSVRKHINSTVFLFKDGNWTSYKLRKRRSTFDLAKQITNQVFAAVNSFMNQTANQTTFDLIDKLLNASAEAAGTNRSSRAANSAYSSADPFRGIDLFNEDSQELLRNLDSFDSFTRLQRGFLQAFSFGLNAARSHGWRVLFDEFRAFSGIPHLSMALLKSIFNSAGDEFQQALEQSDDCWPADKANLSSLGSMFRSSADSMAQCFATVFLDARSVLDDVRANLTAPLTLPMELFQQFNYCDTLTDPLQQQDAFNKLAQSVCLAKIPLLMETYGLGIRTAYNQQIQQAQRALILLKGNLIQCSQDELDTIQGQASAWRAAYGQCMANAATTTSAPTTTTTEAAAA